MKRVIRFSPITFFLILFFVLMCFVFYYSYKINDNIQNYSVNRDNIVSMQLLNKEVDDSTSIFNPRSISS